MIIRLLQLLGMLAAFTVAFGIVFYWLRRAK